MAHALAPALPGTFGSAIALTRFLTYTAERGFDRRVWRPPRAR